MNTPAHVVVNLLLLTRRSTEQFGHRHYAAIMVGAVLPDLVMILFYAWHLSLGTAEAQIWSVEYYRPFWQGWIDSFNSIPLILIAMLISWKTRSYLLLALFSSMLLHVFGDLPVHHDDAHRHFFPLSDWRFESPVSYWDPAHHGSWFSLFEFCAVMAAAIYMGWREARLRPWVIATTTIYLAYLTYVMLVWA